MYFIGYMPVGPTVAGSYETIVFDQAQNEVDAAFQVTTAAFSITDPQNNNLNSGYVADTAAFTASGLAPNTQYDIYFNGVQITSITTDGSGGFDGTFTGATWTIPQMTGGSYDVQLVEHSSGNPIVDTSFSVLAPISQPITVTLENGASGTVYVNDITNPAYSTSFTVDGSQQPIPWFTATNTH